MGMIIGYPYYNSGEELETIIKHYNSFTAPFKMIVVDDGSQDKAEDHIKDCKFDIELYRINEDIYNNCPGANNLLFHTAHGNVLKMDIDYIITEDILKKLMDESGEIPLYYFYDDEQIHTNIFYVNREVFWNTGGYDEDFAGAKGYSDILLYRQWKTLYRSDKYKLISINAPSCKRMISGIDYNKELYDIKCIQMKKKTYKNGKVLRFTWEKINLS
jgi:hypothetical protein